MIDLAALDDAVIARLEAQVAGLRTVQSLDAVEQLDDSGMPSPCAFVLIGGVRYSEPEGRSELQYGYVDVIVFVKARNVRGDGAARKSTDGGAYKLVGDSVAALNGFTPSACSQMYIMSVDTLVADANKAIIAIAFRIDLTEDF